MTRTDQDTPQVESVTSSDIHLAIRKLNGKDRVGTAGQLLATAGGFGAGASAAGAIAGAAGATTLLGSTTLGSVLGGVLVTTTPVGWVIGCALAGAAAAYGVSKAVRSGGRNDRIREEVITRLTIRLNQLQKNRQDIVRTLARLKINIGNAVRDGHISSEQACRLVTLVEDRKLDPQVALARIQAFYA
jgi:hypothetical protein